MEPGTTGLNAMAKKGIVEKSVRAAVNAAKEVLAPSPLAKQLIAAAATQAVGMAEARAKEALPAIEKRVKKTLGEQVVKPVDSALTDEEPARPAKPKRGGAKKRVGRRKSARGTAASRKKSRKKTARSRTTAKAARKTTSKTKRSKAKRR